MGKKLFQARSGVIPAARSTTTASATIATMISPARIGPDPVRDRGGIDIGFLECCRRAGGTAGQQEGRHPGTHAAERGRRTARSYPRRRGWGVPGSRPGPPGGVRAPRLESGHNGPVIHPSAGRVATRLGARRRVLVTLLATLPIVAVPRGVLAHG